VDIVDKVTYDFEWGKEENISEEQRAQQAQQAQQMQAATVAADAYVKTTGAPDEGSPAQALLDG